MEIPENQLDYSYKSLDLVSEKAEAYGLDQVQAELYDSLVTYVGEVIRRRVKGQWVIRQDYPESLAYPTIQVKQRVLMPINVVWNELAGLEMMNLRKEAANEVRRFSVRGGFE
ncbi:MAG: hypothetical protein MUF49_27850 [Oculatellaceae cyanobacterium Prado106]|nr:hypothetical protein [Oculatellaceae cyanobacterium Prado106]